MGKGAGETVKQLVGRCLTGQAAKAVRRAVTWQLEDTELQRVRDKRMQSLATGRVLEICQAIWAKRSDTPDPGARTLATVSMMNPDVCHVSTC